MKIGVCEKDLPGTLEENLEFIAKNGFDGFQVWPDKVKDTNELLRQCSELSIVVSAIGGGPNLVSSAERGKTIDAFRMRFDLAKELGCFIVTAETKEKPAEMSEEEAWESCTENIRAICACAEKTGGALAIEPSGSCFVKDAEDWLELARRVNSRALKVNYDPANIVWAGKNPAEGVRILGSNIIHTHAKDIVFDRKAGYSEGTSNLVVHDVPAGKGKVGYKSYVQALKDAGYDGFLTIEMHHKNTEEILESKEFLENLIGDFQ